MRPGVASVCQYDAVSVSLIVGFAPEVGNGPQLAGMSSGVSELPPMSGSLRKLNSLTDFGQKSLCLWIDFAAGFDQFHKRKKTIITPVLFFTIYKSRQASKVA